MISMVDSNVHRENILPSEKAFVYKMKLDALNRQLGRPSEKVGQVVPNYSGKRSTAVLGENTGDSYKQVQRYIYYQCVTNRRKGGCSKKTVRKAYIEDKVINDI